MLKPVPMRKIRVVGLRRQLEEVVGLLHNLGIVQFTRCEDARLCGEKPLDIYPVISEQLIRMRAIENALEPRPVKKKQPLLSIDELLNECAKITIEKRIGQIHDRLDAIKSETKELSDAASVLERLGGLNIDLSIAKSNEACFFLGRIANEKIKGLEDGIKAVTDRFLFKSQKISNLESICIIVADKTYKEYITSLLQKTGFSEMALPPLPGKPKEVLSIIRGRIAQLEKEQQELNSEIGRLSDEYYSKVVGLREMLEIYAERANAPTNFLRTENVFLFEAWLPSAKYQEVAGALKKKFGEQIIIQPIETHEEPPTMLHNPPILSPFEFLVEFISTPKGNEIDPTLLFALTFPIFYGMMLGDFGYGIASLILALILMNKFKNTMLEPVAKVWAYASIPTMFFGIIYDEFFGFRHYQILGFHLYEGIPRTENINLLLVLTILIGIVHLTLGFILGAINKLREKEWLHAAAKLGWIAVEFSGILLVITAMFHMLPDSVMIPAALLGIIGLIPIMKTEGITGLIEIPSLASNILSYARILAVGVASVVVAELINELLMPNPSQGILMLVMIPLYLSLHLFNIVLGMFESLVQGARLNYVEFFSKFYEGGGIKFNPFKYTKKITV